jgi:hypothetical protein
VQLKAVTSEDSSVFSGLSVNSSGGEVASPTRVNSRHRRSNKREGKLSNANVEVIYGDDSSYDKRDGSGGFKLPTNSTDSNLSDDGQRYYVSMKSKSSSGSIEDVREFFRELPPMADNDTAFGDNSNTDTAFGDNSSMGDFDSKLDYSCFGDDGNRPRGQLKLISEVSIEETETASCEGRISAMLEEHEQEMKTSLLNLDIIDEEAGQDDEDDETDYYGLESMHRRVKSCGDDESPVLTRQQAKRMYRIIHQARREVELLRDNNEQFMSEIEQTEEEHASEMKLFDNRTKQKIAELKSMYLAEMDLLVTEKDAAIVEAGRQAVRYAESARKQLKSLNQQMENVKSQNATDIKAAVHEATNLSNDQKEKEGREQLASIRQEYETKIEFLKSGSTKILNAAVSKAVVATTHKLRTDLEREMADAVPILRQRLEKEKQAALQSASKHQDSLSRALEVSRQKADDLSRERNGIKQSLELTKQKLTEQHTDKIGQFWKEQKASTNDSSGQHKHDPSLSEVESLLREVLEMCAFLLKSTDISMGLMGVKVEEVKKEQSDANKRMKRQLELCNLAKMEEMKKQQEGSTDKIQRLEKALKTVELEKKLLVDRHRTETENDRVKIEKLRSEKDAILEMEKGRKGLAVAMAAGQLELANTMATARGHTPKMAVAGKVETPLQPITRRIPTRDDQIKPPTERAFDEIDVSSCKSSSPSKDMKPRATVAFAKTVKEISPREWRDPITSLTPTPKDPSAKPSKARLQLVRAYRVDADQKHIDIDGGSKSFVQSKPLRIVPGVSLDESEDDLLRSPSVSSMVDSLHAKREMPSPKSSTEADALSALKVQANKINATGPTHHSLRKPKTQPIAMDETQDQADPKEAIQANKINATGPTHHSSRKPKTQPIAMDETQDQTDPKEAIQANKINATGPTHHSSRKPKTQPIAMDETQDPKKASATILKANKINVTSPTHYSSRKPKIQPIAMELTQDQADHQKKKSATILKGFRRPIAVPGTQPAIPDGQSKSFSAGPRPAPLSLAQQDITEENREEASLGRLQSTPRVKEMRNFFEPKAPDDSPRSRMSFTDESASQSSLRVESGARSPHGSTREPQSKLDVIPVSPSEDRDYNKRQDFMHPASERTSFPPSPTASDSDPVVMQERSKNSIGASHEKIKSEARATATNLGDRSKALLGKFAKSAKTGSSHKSPEQESQNERSQQPSEIKKSPVEDDPKTEKKEVWRGGSWTIKLRKGWPHGKSQPGPIESDDESEIIKNDPNSKRASRVPSRTLPKEHPALGLFVEKAAQNSSSVHVINGKKAPLGKGIQHSAFEGGRFIGVPPPPPPPSRADTKNSSESVSECGIDTPVAESATRKQYANPLSKGHALCVLPTSHSRSKGRTASHKDRVEQGLSGFGLEIDNGMQNYDPMYAAPVAVESRDDDDDDDNNYNIQETQSQMRVGYPALGDQCDDDSIEEGAAVDRYAESAMDASTMDKYATFEPVHFSNSLRDEEEKQRNRVPIVISTRVDSPVLYMESSMDESQPIAVQKKTIYRKPFISAFSSTKDTACSPTSSTSQATTAVTAHTARVIRSAVSALSPSSRKASNFASALKSKSKSKSKSKARFASRR